MCPDRLPPPEDLPASYEIIRSWIEPRTEVLDLGCGNGDLLAYLTAEHGCRGEGVELDWELVAICVSRGLPVHNGDIDDGLIDYPDQRFDVVTLSQTLQEVANTQRVIDEILRVGKLAIISFPNFAFWRSRAQLLFWGRAPQTRHLPHNWFDTPNRHVMTITDFSEYCQSRGIETVRWAYLCGRRSIHLWPTLRADTVLVAIRRKPPDETPEE